MPDEFQPDEPPSAEERRRAVILLAVLFALALIISIVFGAGEMFSGDNEPDPDPLRGMTHD